MIAHAFPPEGAAGTYRPLRFTRHLSAHGWGAGVVSADQYFYERYDPGLLDEVPEGIEVVRIRQRDPWQAFQAWRNRKSLRQKRTVSSLTNEAISLNPRHWNYRARLSKVVQKIEAWVYHPDRAMLWIRPAVRATVEMCLRKKADVIWATAGPVSSFFVAQRASQLTGVPYVLDFRDSWTVSYSDLEARRPNWAIRRDRLNMYNFLKGARAVTFRYSAEAECFWRVYPGALDESRIHIIPNGFDGAMRPAVGSRNKHCKILYAGTVSTYRYDTLLKALKSLQKSFPILAERLQLQFVGEGAQTLAQEALNLGIGSMIVASAPISHHDINQLSREADAFLVLGRPATMKGHELMAGAKLFGYLKEGKPIIGILPDGESKNVLRSVGAKTIADVDDSCEIVAIFQGVLTAWCNESLSELIPNEIACKNYSAEHQTGLLVRALEGLPAIDPFVSERLNIPVSLRAEILNRLEPMARRDSI